MGCDGMRIGGVASFNEFLLALHPPVEEPHLAEKCDESSVREPFKQMIAMITAMMTMMMEAVILIRRKPFPKVVLR